MKTSPSPAEMLRDQEAAAWCLTLAEGQLEIADRKAFDRWMNDPANAAAFDEAVRLWQMAGLAADLPATLRVRTTALESYSRATARRWRPAAWKKPQLWTAVAALVAIAVLAALILHGPTATYRTGVGERQVAVLKDGSRLSLDANSEVTVRLSRDRRELVLLRGRAKFDVAKDPLRPFSVHAGDKVVVATGTSFSVELLRNSAHVLLYEGHVAILDRSNPNPRTPTNQGAATTNFILEPGRELVTSLDAPIAQAKIYVVDTGRSRAWESGQLSFEDEPLGTAVDRINRYAPVEVVLGDDAVARVPLNGVFEAGDTEAVIEALAALNGVRAMRSDGKVVLYRN